MCLCLRRFFALRRRGHRRISRLGMNFLRSYLALALTVLMALTGISAQAGMRDAAGQMVICTGTGPVMVYIDSDGQPVSPPMECPECLTFVSDLGLALPVLGHSTLPQQLPRDLAQRTEILPVVRLAAFARGPPELARSRAV
ncbi:hypothetical protein D1822_11820 [Phaeobacter inhibens]|nr:hypothetical protein PGA1_c24160 [Phaeobacter inhibens DSM 17395]AUQ46784.1 hypothetical protein PhaeoP10_02457 [Phaeobacter inhibens]AXT23452.1 hypothetical protein D1822_11820 [Phaeobacter inhibens]